MKNSLLLLVTLVFILLNEAVAQGTFQHQITSTFLNEPRVISISLPEDYSKYEKEYPVVFMLDGEYSFSFAQGSANFLSNDFGFLPKMIVVSIPNTIRSKDFPISLSDQRYADFASFLKSELIPFIEENYRSNGFHTLYGWSSSSGLCMHTLAKNPELFKGLILAGSGIGPQDKAFLESNLPENYDRPTFLHVSAEGGPRARGVLQFQSLIDQKSIPQLTSKFEVLTNATHVGALAEGYYRGINFVFDSFYIPEGVLVQGLDSIINYYSQLSGIFGFDIIMPEGAINESSGILMDHDLQSDAIRLLKYGLEQYNQSATLAGALGVIYMRDDKVDEAKKYFRDAITLAEENQSVRAKYEAYLKSLNK